MKRSENSSTKLSDCNIVEGQENDFLSRQNIAFLAKVKFDFLGSSYIQFKKWTILFE